MSENNKNRLLRSNILKKICKQTFKYGTHSYVADMIDGLESESENLDLLQQKFKDYDVGKDEKGIFTLFELLSADKDLHAKLEKILKDSITITVES